MRYSLQFVAAEIASVARRLHSSAATMPTASTSTDASGKCMRPSAPKGMSELVTSVFVVASTRSAVFHRDGRPHVTTSPMYESGPLSATDAPISRNGNQPHRGSAAR